MVELPRCLLKPDLDFFLKQGYTSPKYYGDAGIFYVQKQGLVANCAFGSARLSVKCGGNQCEMLKEEFLKLLEKVTEKK